MEHRSVTYFVCMVQRCGSNFLCEALSRTGVAGNPTEYLVPHFPNDEAFGHPFAGFEDSIWARQRGISSLPDFVRAVLLEGQTPNGVFGSKLPWTHLEEILQKLRELPGHSGLSDAHHLAAVFGEPRFINMRRRDNVRQAISWALAGQTGHFSSSMAAARPPIQEPSFDIELLDGVYRLIREGEAGWLAFFQRMQVEPLQIYYEDLVADFHGS